LASWRWSAILSYLPHEGEFWMDVRTKLNRDRRPNSTDSQIKTRMGMHLAGELQPVQRSLLRVSCTREKEAPRQEGT
jgi:hypothetical protein